MRIVICVCMFGGGPWQVLGRYLAGSWQVLGRFLAGFWQVLGIAFHDQLKQNLSKAKIKLKLKHS